MMSGGGLLGLGEKKKKQKLWVNVVSQLPIKPPAVWQDIKSL